MEQLNELMKRVARLAELELLIPMNEARLDRLNIAVEQSLLVQKQIEQL